MALDALVSQLVTAWRSHHPEGSDGEASILAAYDFARRAHEGQMRASGEPFITHPLAVARNVADLGMDADTVVAALCHDVVEDTPVTDEELRSTIGAAAATLVDGVTKLDAVAHASREQASASNLRKLLLAATADPRVLVLKVADRMHNASTLGPLEPSRRARIAKETMEVFAPIAHRLGMNEAAAQLEDAAFAALEPDLYAEISARMDQVASRRAELLDRIQTAAKEALGGAEIKATVAGRNKHVYSTWRKTVVRKQKFDEIADLIGIRVIVADTVSCYTALGVLHNRFAPVPGRFRDYIAQPRFGHYQSLHTTVAVEGTVTEVQIRSWAMHAAAEQGIAAHWRYKDPDASAALAERGATIAAPAAPNLPWLHDLLESGHVAQTSPTEYLDSIRRDLGADEVVVFTPTGTPLALPDGATALDAAYAVHTEVGNRCAGTKVNGVNVPRGTVLRPGDQFEILTSTSSKPTHAWLDEVTTGRARNAIRSVLNERERTESRLSASQALLVALRHQGVGRGWEQIASLNDIAPSVGYASGEALLDAFTPHPELVTVAAEKISEQVAGRLPLDDTHPSTSLVPRGVPAPRGGAAVVDGRDDLHVSLGTCCHPVPGRDAVGVPDDTGVTIHAVDCLTLASTDAPLYDVTLTTTDSLSRLRLGIDALHRHTLLCDITTAVADAGAEVVAMTVHTADNHTCHVDLTVAASDGDVLWRLHARLRDLDGTYRVCERDIA